MKSARVTGTSAAGVQDRGEVHADEATAAARTRPIITIEEAPNDEEYELQENRNRPQFSAGPNATNGYQQNKTDDSPHAGTPKPRYAVMIRWNFGYFKTAVGLLRLLFMLALALSLVCLSNAGTEDEDVLQLEARARIRLHVFACILALLVQVLICILEVTSIKDALPYRWPYMDIFSTFILGTLCIMTSTLLLHSLNTDPEDLVNGDDDGSGNGGSGNGSGFGSGSGSGDGQDEEDDDDDGMPKWSKGLLAVAAVFGYLGTLASVFLIVFKCIAHKSAKAACSRTRSAQEEVMMLPANS